MRVLIAPDKFKGTLTAPQAAEAIAAGLRRAFPTAGVETLPMADGGEGTLDTMLAALGGERLSERVTGPLGGRVTADYAVVDSPDGLLAVVEMARASGLGLISDARRNPLRATTFGTGELILACVRRGVERVLVCIGGSATNEGGAGMAQALGVKLLDADGRALGPGGAQLIHLARIDMAGLDDSVARARFVVATDVDNPLIGPGGASAVYGPQKGASPDDVALLDQALAHFAAVVYRDLGVDVRDLPGAGAAGGLGAGLVAFLGARLRPGVDVVMKAVGFRARLDAADVVVTGEGAFDSQSLRGKVPAGVLREAALARVPAVILCGRRDPDLPVPDPGTGPPATIVRSLEERFGPEAAVEGARPLLEQLAFEVAPMVQEGLHESKR